MSVQIVRFQIIFTPMASVNSTKQLPTTLTKTQLTMALILVTLLPFGLVVLMYTSMPTFSDPELQVKVEVGPRAWPDSAAPEARLVPCVVIRNPTGDSWNYLNMSINHQFHFTHPDPVLADGEVIVPLKFFHTKGNSYYPPESQPLKTLTIFAQIPSGARAIAEFSGQELGFTGPAQAEPH